MEGKFDLVLCSEVIEHVLDDQAVLANLFALVRPRRDGRTHHG